LGVLIFYFAESPIRSFFALRKPPFAPLWGMAVRKRRRCPTAPPLTGCCPGRIGGGGCKAFRKKIYEEVLLFGLKIWVSFRITAFPDSSEFSDIFAIFFLHYFFFRHYFTEASDQPSGRGSVGAPWRPASVLGFGTGHCRRESPPPTPHLPSFQS